MPLRFFSNVCTVKIHVIWFQTVISIFYLWSSCAHCLTSSDKSWYLVSIFMDTSLIESRFVHDWLYVDWQMFLTHSLMLKIIFTQIQSFTITWIHSLFLFLVLVIIHTQSIFSLFRFKIARTSFLGTFQFSLAHWCNSILNCFIDVFFVDTAIFNLF